MYARYRHLLITLAAAAVCLCLSASIGLAPVRAASADAPLAIATIVEGDAVLLRQTQRLRLVEGTRLVSQDIVETPAEARSVLRIEFTDGLAINLGPATRLLIDPQFHGERGRFARVYLLAGWTKLKAPAKPPAGAPRPIALLASPALDVLEADGSTVLHLADPAFGFFVETGNASVQERRSARATGTPRPLRGGQYLVRSGAAEPTVASRPEPAFIDRMPRVFLDTLPDRAALFRERVAVPKPIGGIAYADVADWMSVEATLRRPAMKRWRELTRDAAFRNALVANMKAHPEWIGYFSRKSTEPTGEARQAAPGWLSSRTGARQRQPLCRALFEELEMKLLLKFNLVFLLVFAVGLGVSGYIARTLLQQEAQAEVIDRARLLMEKARVVSSYTANQVAPLLSTQMRYTFLPQSIPAYSSTEVINALQKTYPDYTYKAAMLNPTNPRDRAVAWEEDVINQFRRNKASEEFIGQRETPAGRAIYIARPIVISNERCLTCHSTPEAAPKPLIDKYGPSNGFGWTLHETIGAQVVSVPMTLPLQRADRSFGVVMAMLAGVFLLIGIALNLMLWKLVIQPVSRLSALSDRVSMGELDAPEFSVRSKDEIGVLAESFGRMRKSLVHAMKMLES